MLLLRNTRRRCRGFTLVELMVAAALAVTIMWILAESFKMGIDFARNARSTGDMMTQLNNAGQIMMRDLGQSGAFSASGKPQHFLPPQPPLPQITGAMRNIVQVPMPDNLMGVPATAPAAATGYIPPSGYFHLYSPPPAPGAPSWASFSDDSEGFYIDTMSPQTDAVKGLGHQLQFTAYLPQGLPQNQFVTTCPPGVTNNNPPYSPAAEIGYFLGSPAGAGQPTGYTAPQVVVAGMTNPPLNGGAALPLYNLYRRQRLVAVNTDFASLQSVLAAAFANEGITAADVISATFVNGQPTINTMAIFGSANPVVATRVPMVPLGTTPGSNVNRLGHDILLSNVLSFEVLATWDSNPQIVVPSTKLPTPWPRPFPQNSNYPYDYLPLVNFNPAYPYTFDTWYGAASPVNIIQSLTFWTNFSRAPNNPNLIPMPIRVNGLQITIRIYDPKTHQARQNTWRVAL